MARFVKCAECYVNVDAITFVWPHRRSGDAMTLNTIDGTNAYLAGGPADAFLEWLEQSTGGRDGEAEDNLEIG